MYLNYCQRGLRVWGSSKINKSIWNTVTISSILQVFSLTANPKASWKVLFIPPLEFPRILRHNHMWDPSSSTYLTTFVTSHGIINKAIYTLSVCEGIPCTNAMKIICEAWCKAEVLLCRKWFNSSPSWHGPGASPRGKRSYGALSKALSTQ